jgi:hypothetical protein
MGSQYNRVHVKTGSSTRCMKLCAHLACEWAVLHCCWSRMHNQVLLLIVVW